MKHHHIMITAAAALTTTALAGTTQSVMTESPPMQQSYVSSGWFIGGSFGQLNGVDHNGESLLNDSFNFDGIIGDLTDGQILDGGSFSGGDIDFDMYTLHVGRSWGSGFSGFSTSLYLEVGYLNGDTDISYNGPLNDIDPGDLSEIDEDVLDALDDLGFIGRNPDIDIDIIPVTLNFMAERNLVGGLGVYLGAGAGYGFTDTDAFGDSDTDGGFIAQASAGLVYNFTETFEMFGGARWMYLNDYSILGSGTDADDDLLFEIGLRFNLGPPIR